MGCDPFYIHSHIYYIYIYSWHGRSLIWFIGPRSYFPLLFGILPTQFKAPFCRLLIKVWAYQFTYILLGGLWFSKKSGFSGLWEINRCEIMIAIGKQKDTKLPVLHSCNFPLLLLICNQIGNGNITSYTENTWFSNDSNCFSYEAVAFLKSISNFQP